MMEPQERTLEKRWTAPRAKFEALCHRLESDEALGMSHSGVESVLDVDGKEILRLLFQDHLALRAERETPPSTALVGRDSIARTYRRRHCRPLETLFGTVEVSRLGHGQRGMESLHPLDGELNLPVERYSFGAHRRVAEAAAMGSFDAAVATLSATTAASVPKRQAEELARRAAHDFEAFYEAKAEIADKPGALVVMSLDGKGVVMRVEDLKAATRKKAQATKHKRMKRLSPGEKRNSKRIATVAAVYTIDKHPRTPREVAVPTPGERKPAPRPVGKRVWASLERPIEQVVVEMFEEAFRQDPAGKKT